MRKAPDRLLETIKREKMTRRSWWDGGNPRGPIATRWNVRGWPTIYVLDGKGVIRFKGVRGKKMDEAVVNAGSARPAPFAGF